jgi:hypothetical protein
MTNARPALHRGGRKCPWGLEADRHQNSRDFTVKVKRSALTHVAWIVSG